jgi:hypothetical protein
MANGTKAVRPGPFELGFEHGAEAVEEASLLEMVSRVVEYRLGYVTGRCYSHAVREVSLEAGFTLAGQLGVRFDLDIADLLSAMQMSAEHRSIVECEYQRHDTPCRKS